jgi:SAM-dependent methyltransferase
MSNSPLQVRPQTIAGIDFGQLYRSHMMASGGRRKPPEHWDARAEQMDRRSQPDSSYVTQFMGQLNLQDCATVLDVGCGSGAIALALAPQVETVFAIDYSTAMLERMMCNARSRGIGNIVPLLRSWEDDWLDIPACDLAIASRSTAVMDLESALHKLDAKARKRACLTSATGSRFVNPMLLEALDRAVPAAGLDKPDYIYAINLLYRMGRRPRVDYIERESRGDRSPDAEEFVRAAAFAIDSLSDLDIQKLTAWRAHNPAEPIFIGQSRDAWAFIAWDV